MPKADRVLSTPPTNTSAISTSAPGAVQLSSPPVILTSHAHAGQGVKKMSQNLPALRGFRKAAL
jgi:hypothetical protein